jgi:cell division protease FtsH
MAMLIGGLVAAQMLMGEMLSGYNFHPDRPDRSLTLDDVIGYPQEKQEIRELLAQLEAAKYQAEGEGPRVPRGMLLSGPPGVGKTMIARAIAGSLKAEFFTCTGADFVEMYVGVGPKRVRALFRQARRASSAVIFIDEIDALGSRDNQNMDSERMATINRMLAEMDGMNGQGNFLVIGATNHPDRLDAALRRPGRFDRQIHIPLPDAETRAGILSKYLEKVPAATDVDLRALALRTQGYSGAHLRQVVEEAHKLATREQVAGESVQVRHEHLERGQEVALLGVAQRLTVGTEARRAAVHELGHALVGHLCCPGSHVEKVTIVGRGQALGYTLTRPAHEQMLETEANLKGQLAMMLGGRAAEQVMLHSVSNGAMDDLDRANKLARGMVGQLGMGQNFGLRTVIQTRDGEWPAVAENDVSALLDEAYALAQKLLNDHKAWLTERTEKLLQLNVLHRDLLFPDGWDETTVATDFSNTKALNGSLIT